MLDSKTSALPGPWRNAMTPYLIGVMDAMLDYETEEIVLCKASQLGGTEAILNILGYIIQQDPSPTMVVYPSDVLAESVAKNRIVPMIEASPALRERYQANNSKKLELQFDGIYLPGEGAHKDIPEPQDFYHQHSHHHHGPCVEVPAGLRCGETLLRPLPSLRQNDRAAVVPSEVPRRGGHERKFASELG